MTRESLRLKTHFKHLSENCTIHHLQHTNPPSYNTFRTPRLMLEMKKSGGEHGPSRLLELKRQVGDPPIPVFLFIKSSAGSCLSSACALIVSQAMAFSS